MMNEFKRGQRFSDLSAKDLNRTSNSATDMRQRFTVSPPLEITVASGGGGPHIRLNPAALEAGFWAKLTSYSATTHGYAWQEVNLLTDGTFSVAPQGRSGTTTHSPAIEVNGKNISSSLPLIAWLVPGFFDATANAEGVTGQEYLFSYPTQKLAVLDKNGATVDGAVGSIKATANGGLTWSELSAGNVQIVGGVTANVVRVVDVACLNGHLIITKQTDVFKDGIFFGSS